MWIEELRNPHTFFTKVTPRELLDHLTKYEGGLDRPTGVELIPILHKLRDSEPWVSQFKINMEEAQKKLLRKKLTTSENMLAAFATYMLLKAG